MAEQIKYGLNFRASDLAPEIQKFDRDKQGVNTWNKLLYGAQQGYQSEVAPIITDYSKDIAQAYQANYEQQHGIASAGLTAGATQREIGNFNTDWLKQTYQNYLSNYAKQINTATESYTNELGAIQQGLQEKGQLYADIGQSVTTYINQLLNSETIAPDGTTVKYIDTLPTELQNALYGRTEEEMQRLMFNDDGSLTDLGRQLYGIGLNFAEKGYTYNGNELPSYDYWISKNNPDLRTKYINSDVFRGSGEDDYLTSFKKMFGINDEPIQYKDLVFADMFDSNKSIDSLLSKYGFDTDTYDYYEDYLTNLFGEVFTSDQKKAKFIDELMQFDNDADREEFIAENYPDLLERWRNKKGMHLESDWTSGGRKNVTKLVDNLEQSFAKSDSELEKSMSNYSQFREDNQKLFDRRQELLTKIKNKGFITRADKAELDGLQSKIVENAQTGMLKRDKKNDTNFYDKNDIRKRESATGVKVHVQGLGSGRKFDDIDITIGSDKRDKKKEFDLRCGDRVTNDVTLSKLNEFTTGDRTKSPEKGTIAVINRKMYIYTKKGWVNVEGDRSDINEAIQAYLENQ